MPLYLPFKQYFNVKDYGATGNGSTDDTVAVQATIDACHAAGGGTVYFPTGEYVISGALQDTGARNGQLLIPTVSTSVAQITIRFLGGGARPPFAPAGPAPDPGGYSIIRSTLTGASGTAACISGGNEVFTSKNNVSVVVENLLCMAPDNPTFTFWNLSSTQGGAIRDLMITMTSWSSATVPTNSNAYGIKLPQRGQSNYTHVDGLCVYIFYTGVQIGELTSAKGLIFAGCDAAVELTESPHPSQILEMHQTGCRTGIRVVDGTATWPVRCDVLLYNSEHMDTPSGALVDTVYDLDDPDNGLHGSIRWGNALFTGPITSTFIVNGGANALITEIGEGGAGGLVLLAQQTASASATLDFTSFISSRYDEYLIEGVALTPATDAVNLLMRVGTGGGPTYDAGANYFGSLRTGTGQVDVVGAVGTPRAGSSNGNVTNADAGGSSIMIAKTINVLDTGYGHASFNLRLMIPQSTTKMKSIYGTSTWHNGSEVFMAMCGYLYGSTTALTAVRFLMSSGNIASGVIRVYGIAK